MHRVPGPCAMVIFGGPGDLTAASWCRRSTTSHLRRLLPAGFRVGFGRADWAATRASATRCARVASSTRARRSPTPSWASFAEPLLLCQRHVRRRRRLYGELQSGWTSSTQRAAPPATACSTWPTPPDASSRSSSTGSATPGLGRDRQRRLPARIVIEKPFGHDLASAAALNDEVHQALPRARRSSASTTTWARRRCRTSWCSASPTASSSRSGTATSSTTCRSPWPSRSASRAAAASTRRPARCATWCRTTCCRC